MKTAQHHEAEYMNDTLIHLKSAFKLKRNLSKPHLFIIQTGSWDLAYTSFRAAIERVSSFMTEVSVLNEEMKKLPNKKLVFVATPSLPNRSLHRFGYVSRSNEITAVLNK